MKKNQYNISPIVLILFLFCNCSPGSKLSGVYSGNRTYTTFVLKDDSTFSYQYKFEFDYKYSIGKWSRVGKNTISLNSHYKEKLLQLKTEQSIDSSDNIDLTIITPGFERKYYECLIFINDSLYAKHKCDSVISLSVRKPVENVFLGLTADLKADTILITRSLDTIYTEKFYPKPDTFNKYTLRIAYNDSLFNYKIFNNEILKISRKGLIFYDPKQKVRQTIPKQLL